MAAEDDVDVDYDEHAVTITPPAREAAEVKAVLVALQRGLASMGAFRTAASLMRLNQRKGFDCPGCAWPEEHGGRKLAEFCENGAKAVAEEATKRVVTPEFFARHSIADLAARPEYWLSQQGRLTHPMVLRASDQHYRPIGWDDAYRLIAEHLHALDSPNEAVFYTSGRTSNEAAFLYQLMVRSFGTNNLPDCSNMCHESSGAALSEAIGIGKGSVTVADVAAADLHHHRRPKPRHKPSADAVGAREGKSQRRQDHRGEPATRGRIDPVQGPAEGERRDRDMESRSPTSSSRSASAATWRCSPDWAGYFSKPTTRPRAQSSTATSSRRTARTSRSTRRTPVRSTWTRCSRRRASTAPSWIASPRW